MKLVKERIQFSADDDKYQTLCLQLTGTFALPFSTGFSFSVG